MAYHLIVIVVDFHVQHSTVLLKNGFWFLFSSLDRKRMTWYMNGVKCSIPMKWPWYELCNSTICQALKKTICFCCYYESGWWTAWCSLFIYHFNSLWKAAAQHIKELCIYCLNATRIHSPHHLVYEHYYSLSLPWKSMIQHLFCWTFFSPLFIPFFRIDADRFTSSFNQQRWTLNTEHNYGQLCKPSIKCGPESGNMHKLCR